ncbi:hypothetical protein NC653_026752 [Populus alba x Populus x berolinensis]|uniref:COP9 signalosome complex subunit 6 n=2 Tax=Populus TaxID=3689 RepID=A0A8X7YW83_POPTO|nr:hypothetical protein POTOM_040310 [Populus tomentosa]KAJ6978443.1 hypothetical protein NC653_026752 [Populus alba x Populus x berolinensis]
MASSSSSGLTFKLHPLVIVNISDHYTRVKSQANGCSDGGSASPPPRVYGCVIGVQRGRTVEIFNSFELLYDPVTHSLDRPFIEKKQELYKKVFPHFYILGWYSTGSDAEESDMHIHKALMDINESPVYVLLNPSINPAQKDLPVTIYESGMQPNLYVIDRLIAVIDTNVGFQGGKLLLYNLYMVLPCSLMVFLLCVWWSLVVMAPELHVIDGIPQLIFVCSSYTIETVEAERISVDHVAHLKPSDGGSAATQLAAHLTGIHSAIKMLNSRIRVLHHYLVAMQKGEIPCENSLLRQVSSLLRRLPAIESEKFQDDFLMEYNDTLLIAYLAMFTNCSSTMNELVDKFNTAYDRHSRRGGRTAFI